jgi:hypothetical protein
MYYANPGLVTSPLPPKSILPSTVLNSRLRNNALTWSSAVVPASGTARAQIWTTLVVECLALWLEPPPTGSAPRGMPPARSVGHPGRPSDREAVQNGHPAWHRVESPDALADEAELTVCGKPLP